MCHSSQRARTEDVFRQRNVPDRTECRTLYQTGLTMLQVADRLGCGQEAVRTRVQDLARRKGRPRREEVRSMLRRQRGISVQDLAKQEGYDPSYLYRLIRHELGGLDQWKGLS